MHGDLQQRQTAALLLSAAKAAEPQHIWCLFHPETTVLLVRNNQLHILGDCSATVLLTAAVSSSRCDQASG
jgi:cyanophycinase-like exopeptidase